MDHNVNLIKVENKQVDKSQNSMEIESENQNKKNKQKGTELEDIKIKFKLQQQKFLKKNKEKLTKNFFIE